MINQGILMSTTQTNPLTRKVKPSLEPGRHQDLQVDHLVLRGAAAAAAAQKIHRHDLQPPFFPASPQSSLATQSSRPPPSKCGPPGFLAGGREGREARTSRAVPCQRGRDCSWRPDWRDCRPEKSRTLKRVGRDRMRGCGLAAPLGTASRAAWSASATRVCGAG